MAIEKKINFVILGLLSHEDLTGYEIKNGYFSQIFFGSEAGELQAISHIDAFEEKIEKELQYLLGAVDTLRNSISPDDTHKCRKKEDIPFLYHAGTKKRENRFLYPLCKNPLFTRFFGLAKVSLQKSFESFSMSSFISSHFMHCIMDSVKI